MRCEMGRQDDTVLTVPHYSILYSTMPLRKDRWCLDLDLDALYMRTYAELSARATTHCGTPSYTLGADYDF